MVEYVPRIADGQLTDRLAALGAVVIEGPKACGKTATARQRAGSEVLLDVDIDAVRAVAIDPRLILDGPVPRLIDEWHDIDFVSGARRDPRLVRRFLHAHAQLTAHPPD